MEIDSKTLKQLEEIEVIKHKPMIISDADEVLVHFAKPLELFLAEHGMSISFTSYKLFGNVRYNADNKPVPKKTVFELLQGFFQEKVHTCPPVANVGAALDRLSKNYQIVILSNTPFSAKNLRKTSLEENGINFPLITNEGHKGVAVRKLADKANAPTVFLDDIPHHHTSVAQNAPNVHRIHFVADRRLARLLPPADHSHARIDNWLEAEAYLNDFLLNSDK